MRPTCVLEYSISPARSVVISPFLSGFPVYSQTGHMNISIPGFIPSCFCLHIGQTAVEGKNWPMIKYAQKRGLYEKD